jgi:hypothetical protein
MIHVPDANSRRFRRIISTYFRVGDTARGHDYMDVGGRVPTVGALCDAGSSYRGSPKR